MRRMECMDKYYEILGIKPEFCYIGYDNHHAVACYYKFTKAHKGIYRAWVEANNTLTEKCFSWFKSTNMHPCF